MGKEQAEYDLITDLSKRKVDITFAQMVGICPRMKKEWRRAVNSGKKRVVHKVAKNIMSITKPPDICPSMEAWHKGYELGEAYIDGGVPKYV